MKRQCGKWGLSIGRSYRPALYVVSIACLCSMVAAQAGAPPTTPPPCEGYSRDLVSTVWGFILTFVALTLDDWGTWKNLGKDFLRKVLMVIVGGPLNPFVTLLDRVKSVTWSWVMWRRMSTPETRSYIRTLSGCGVVVNLSTTAYADFHNLSGFSAEMDVEDFSDVLVIGNEVDRKETNVQLTSWGKEMLVKTGVLPPVERLKILQGNSGLAVAVSAAQGVGYMYGIVVRIVQGRHLSPVEAIGSYLSIIILIKAVLHYFTSSCHRPLVLFLDDKKEIEFINLCRAAGSDVNIRPYITGLLLLITGTIIYVLPSGVLVFLTFNIVRSTSLTIVIPLIILVVSILLAFCNLLVLVDILSKENDYIVWVLFFIVPIMYAVAYIFSLVLTWKYWNSLGFDINTTGYLSKILPYIG